MRERRPQPVGPSVASLCHPWFTTTNLSYRFPIFEISATAVRYYWYKHGADATSINWKKHPHLAMFKIHCHPFHWLVHRGHWCRSARFRTRQVGRCLSISLMPRPDCRWVGVTQQQMGWVWGLGVPFWTSSELYKTSIFLGKFWSIPTYTSHISMPAVRKSIPARNTKEKRLAKT